MSRLTYKLLKWLDPAYLEGPARWGQRAAADEALQRCSDVTHALRQARGERVARLPQLLQRLAEESVLVHGRHRAKLGLCAARRQHAARC